MIGGGKGDSQPIYQLSSKAPPLTHPIPPFSYGSVPNCPDALWDPTGDCKESRRGKLSVVHLGQRKCRTVVLMSGGGPHGVRQRGQGGQ